MRGPSNKASTRRTGRQSVVLSTVVTCARTYLHSIESPSSKQSVAICLGRAPHRYRELFRTLRSQRRIQCNRLLAVRRLRLQPFLEVGVLIEYKSECF